MNNFNDISRRPSFFLLVFTLVLGFSSCKKDDQPGVTDNSKISQVVADNFNLSIFNTGLNRTGLNKTMLEQGPFTVIAPSDDAFAKAGFASTAALISAEPARISSIMNYHILNGSYELNKLPFLFNQEIRSANGGKLFVTHWVKGADTVLTINGSLVLAQNIKASNGLIQVIDRMLEPYTYDYVVDAIASDRDLSLFYQALQRAGLTEMLKGKGPYTVFAPNNAAMTAYGLSTLEIINDTDAAQLAATFRYHILADRRFVYDYILSTGVSAQSDQTMSDGNSIKVRLKPNPQVPGSFSGIELLGTGSTSAVQLTKQDALTGNGVLHTIGSVLKITQ